MDPKASPLIQRGTSRLVSSIASRLGNKPSIRDVAVALNRDPGQPKGMMPSGHYERGPFWTKADHSSGAAVSLLSTTALGNDPTLAARFSAATAVPDILLMLEGFEVSFWNCDAAPEAVLDVFRGAYIKFEAQVGGSKLYIPLGPYVGTRNLVPNVTQATAADGEQIAFHAPVPIILDEPIVVDVKQDTLAVVFPTVSATVEINILLDGFAVAKEDVTNDYYNQSCSAGGGDDFDSWSLRHLIRGNRRRFTGGR